MRNTFAWCLALIFLAGNIIGLNIGYIPVIIQSYTDGTNCTSLAENADTCQWADHRICTWSSVNNTCEFSADAVSNISCESFDEDECEAESDSCMWTQTSTESSLSCHFQQGWTKTNTALVATLSVFGGLLGSLIVNLCITKAGANNTIALSGITSVLACVFLIAGWQSYDGQARLALILTGRFFSGLCIGIASAAVPIYVGDVAPRESAGVLGVGFQVFITFGIMTAALCGFAANPSLDELHPRRGVTAMNIYTLVLSVALVPTGFFAEKPLFDDATRNSLLTFRNSAFLRLQPGGGAWGGGGGGKDSVMPGGLGADSSRSLFRRPLYVAVAILIAAGQQLSGINALMSYVTQMAADLGMQNPYLAGFVVMIWNFLSTLAAIYLAYRMTAGNMFLLGEFIAALSCFVVGTAIFFAENNRGDTVPQVFIIGGVLLFIFAFEFGMGPSFYVLAQSMFPSEIRSSGCSFTIFCQFMCNLLVSFLYPILTSTFSGGPSKPQGRGISIMFMIYGGLGLVLTCALRKVMQLIKEELREPGDEIGDGGAVETRDALTQY